MLEMIPSFYANFSKNSFLISSNTYEMDILSKKYCIAHHDAEMCFLSKCRYQFFLLDNVEEFVQELDFLCSTHQHGDCLYELFKYRFIGKIVIKTAQVFDNVQRAVYFPQRTEDWTECPALRKWDFWKKV